MQSGEMDPGSADVRNYRRGWKELGGRDGRSTIGLCLRRVRSATRLTLATHRFLDLVSDRARCLEGSAGVLASIVVGRFLCVLSERFDGDGRVLGQ